MQRFGNQLLADAGLALDQHRQVASGHEIDLLLQLSHRRAPPDQAAAAWSARQPEPFGALALELQARLQLGDVPCNADRRRGELAERFQGVQIRVREPIGIECVQGQQTPRPVSHSHDASNAIVHGQVAVHAGDQPIVGVGQLTVGRKAQGPCGFQQGGKSRMLVGSDSTPHRVRAQTVDRERDQHVALEAQQGCSVTGQQQSQCVKQASVALLR